MAALLGILAATTFIPSAAGAGDAGPLAADVTVRSATFGDIAGNEHEAAIEFLAAQGLTTGFPDNTYRPLDIVGCDSMAAFMNRFSGTYCRIDAASNFPEPTAAPVTDMPVDLQFAREIGWMEDSGFSVGRPVGSYGPFQAVARDAMAAFIQRRDLYNGQNGGRTPPVPEDNPWLNTALESAERAFMVTAAMNLDQKVEYLVQSGGTGVPEFGLPALRSKDRFTYRDGGLALTAEPSTSLPVGLALASTFDATLARQTAGFGSITLPPAGAGTVNITLDPLSLQYWDTGANQFVTPMGPLPIYVGGSACAREPALTGSVMVRSGPCPPSRP